MEMCQVADIASRGIRALSAGQRKRVALADATLLLPRVLLLDDFLAGLDRTMREAAGNIISTVAAFSSVIVTGHEIAEMSRWTTRFLVLRDGVISATLPAARADADALVKRVDLALKGGAS
jgi:ABC-type sulfate/molybdate transport systems ATPase subunit